MLVPEKSYDFVGWPYYDPISYEIIGAFSEREGPHAVWFNDLYANLQKQLNGYFPGMFVHVMGSNQAQNLYLVQTYSCLLYTSRCV